MYPKIFNFFSTYALMILIGLALALLIIYKYIKKNHYDIIYNYHFTNLAIASIIIGFFSAMLFQSFYIYLDDPSEGFKFYTAMTFYGGFIGGVSYFFLAYFLYFRKKHGAKLENYLPIIVPAISLAHGFGRLGCFFGGCCYGIETTSILGVQFPFLPYKVYPTQLFEAVFLFMIFGITFFLAHKKKFNYNLTIYLMSYGIFRFLIEFIRGDYRGQLVDGITPSQFWSIIIFILGIASIFLIKYRDKVSNFLVTIIDFFLGKEIFRFLIAGAINTLMGGILIPFIFSQFINLDIFIDIPLVLGYLCWFTFAYFIQIKFVFKSTFEWKRFWAYPLSQIPNLLLNLGFKYIFSLFIDNELITYILSALLPIPIMFFIVRFIVKNNKEAKD